MSKTTKMWWAHSLSFSDSKPSRTLFCLFILLTGKNVIPDQFGVWFFFFSHSPIEKNENKLADGVCLLLYFPKWLLILNNSVFLCSGWGALFWLSITWELVGFFWKFCTAGILFKCSFTSRRCCSGSWPNSPWQELFHTSWENRKIIQTIRYPSMHSDIAELLKLFDSSLLQEEAEERSAAC